MDVNDASLGATEASLVASATSQNSRDWGIDLAPLIVLEPKVRRRAREIRDEHDRRGPLRARVRELRHQVRTLVEHSPPEGAHPGEAAAFTNELEEMLSTKYAIDHGDCARLEPLAESLTDLLERCRAWHLEAERDP